MPKIQASAPAASAEQSPVEITLTLGEGRPVDPPDLESSDRYEVVSATVFMVRTALAQMGARSPEYARLAEVADAMLMRLDTIRDENKFLTAARAGREELQEMFTRDRLRFEAEHGDDEWK